MFDVYIKFFINIIKSSPGLVCVLKINNNSYMSLIENSNN